MRRAQIAAVIVLFTAACASPSRDTYVAEEVGQVIEVTEGRVVAVRPVDIEGDNSGVGAAAGGLAGGIGAAVAVAGPLGFAAFVVGSLVGAAVGYLAEDTIRDADGLEYIIGLDDGRYMTVVQNQEDGEAPLPIGASVLVQYGTSYTRVIGQPGLPASGDGWANPDELPADVETQTPSLPIGDIE